jgi:hypothetical protein
MKKSRVVRTKTKPVKQRHAAVRGEVLELSSKFAPMKSDGAEVLRVKRRSKSFCECGKVETDEPVAMCTSCTECGVRMHTLSDVKQHMKCLEVPLSPVDDEDIVPTAQDKPARRSKQHAPTRSIDNASMEDEHWRWHFFFSCQRNPILRSQLLTSLMAGTPLEIARLPTEVLLDVVLIATATREFHEAEVVDDYDELLTLTEEAWKRPDWTTKVFDSIHCNWADSILNRGRRDFDSPETKYVPSLVGWYLQHDPPVYFKKELTR